MWFTRVFAITTVLFLSGSCVTDGLKILGLFPMPGKSHFSLGEQLFKTLAKRGHQVDVVSHFPLKKPFPNYNDISIAGSAPISVNNVSIGMTQNISSFDLQAFIETTGTNTCDLLQLPQLQELLKKPKGFYDVVIVESFTFHCYFAFGRHYDAPMIAVTTTKLNDWFYGPFATSTNPAYVATNWVTYSQQMTFVERLINTFYSTIFPPVFHYYLEVECSQVEKYFGRKLSSITELYDDIALLFVNSHYSIDQIRPLTPDIIEIGGLHVENDDQQLTPELKKWLDESSHGCVYISFGSMVRIETLPADKIQAFYEMFKSIEPARILMKIADPKLLPPNLPKNVKTSSWLPQIAILKHKNVKAFVTHGGLMGTQEAVATGVPMIGFPLFGDQHINIENYVKKNIAVKLDINKFDAESLTSAVKEVLNKPEYTENMKRVAMEYTDRPMSARDTVIYWTEFVAKYGNRLRSPALKLTWWQYYLVDVYGFMLTSILLVLYVTKKIFCFIFQMIFSKKSQKKKSNPSMNTKKNK